MVVLHVFPSPHDVFIMYLLACRSSVRGDDANLKNLTEPSGFIDIRLLLRLPALLPLTKANNEEMKRAEEDNGELSRG